VIWSHSSRHRLARKGNMFSHLVLPYPTTVYMDSFHTFRITERKYEKFPLFTYRFLCQFLSKRRRKWKGAGSTSHSLKFVNFILFIPCNAATVNQKIHIVVPQIFILQYHTELSLMFRSTRDNHQGIKPEQYRIKPN